MCICSLDIYWISAVYQEVCQCIIAPPTYGWWEKLLWKNHKVKISIPLCLLALLGIQNAHTHTHKYICTYIHNSFHNMASALLKLDLGKSILFLKKTLDELSLKQKLRNLNSDSITKTKWWNRPWPLKHQTPWSFLKTFNLNLFASLSATPFSSLLVISGTPLFLRKMLLYDMACLPSTLFFV